MNEGFDDVVLGLPLSFFTVVEFAATALKVIAASLMLVLRALWPFFFFAPLLGPPPPSTVSFSLNTIPSSLACFTSAYASSDT